MKGFTLLEMLLALSIASTALVVMLARLGASADLLQNFETQLIGMETAIDLLERERLEAIKKEGQTGRVSVQDIEMTWQSKITATEFEQVKRHDYILSRDGEADVELFLYRVEKAQP
ncbi:MAG: type II secretion system protein [Mariprofundaceae bacterium]|nr:type II secretion system protein [Mariprofundaceae bacterium]